MPHENHGSTIVCLLSVCQQGNHRETSVPFDRSVKTRFKLSFCHCTV